MYVCTYVCIYVCVYVPMYVCIYVCLYYVSMNVCIPTHTRTRIIYLTCVSLFSFFCRHFTASPSAAIRATLNTANFVTAKEILYFLSSDERYFFIIPYNTY